MKMDKITAGVFNKSKEIMNIFYERDIDWGTRQRGEKLSFSLAAPWQILYHFVKDKIVEKWF